MMHRRSTASPPVRLPKGRRRPRPIVRFQRRGMGRVLRHDQHERFDHRLIVAAGVVFQLHLDELVVVDAIFQLDFLEPLGVVQLGAEVFAGGDCRNLHIAILQGAGQRVVINNVGKLAWIGPHGLRRRGQLNAQHRPQIVDSLGPRAGVIAVRLVHQHHQGVVEIGFAEVFPIATHPRHAGLGRPRLVLAGVDIGDVEDVEMRRRVRAEHIAGQGCRHGKIQTHAAPASATSAATAVERRMKRPDERQRR